MPITLLTPWPGVVSGTAVLAAGIFFSTGALFRRFGIPAAGGRLRYSEDPASPRARPTDMHPRPQTPTLLFCLGAALLAVAAATPVWMQTGTDRVTVMVDLSPSTRGADYRNRRRLTARIAELLGNTPVDLIAFAGSNASLPAGDVLPDMPTDRTTFAPPPGRPVLLFSDGQFDLPPDTPPVFAVVDPQLIAPDDSAVASLNVVHRTVTAVVHHSGPARQATWTGTTAGGPINLTQPIALSVEATGTNAIRLALNAGDRWPENDSLAVLPPPPERRPRWWVGDRDPGPGWTRVSPSQLPTSLTGWLDPSVVVLGNVPAAALDRLQQDALLRYARDLGGGVILLGGEHAFAAGGYGPTPLGAISPLADAPPTPAARWIILIDASGSMAAPGPAGSLFDAECAAARSLLPLLPPADPVRVIAFSRGTQQWIDGPAATAVNQPLPPPGAGPNGPTVLEPALRSALSASSLPTRLMLMTDADTDPVDAGAMSSLAAAANARLLVLALGRGAALPSLAEVARRTGGSVVEQPSPAAWSAAARTLLQAQLPDHLERSPIAIHFTGELTALGIRRAGLWNRTWLKRGATRWATAGASEGAGIPIAARWSVGTGSVAAVAFGLSPADTRVLADRVATAPADPRFAIEWDTRHSRPRVTVTASDAGHFLNQQPLALDCVTPDSSAAFAERAIPQVAPGTYAVDLPPSPETRFARVRLGFRTLDRRAIAGRYAEEFDALGINESNLNALAARSGGAVLHPNQTTRLHPSFARTQLVLARPLIGVALLCIATGLWLWKRGRAAGM